MQERLSKKEPDVWSEIDKILQKEQFGKAWSPELQPASRWVLREPSHTRYTYLASRALLQNWLEIFNKARDLPRAEFIDDITELRQEIDTLYITVDSLRQELASSKRRINELSKKIDEIHPLVETNTIAKLCEAYVKIVSSIGMVQKVIVVETMDVTTIWTIIDAPPFEDSLRTPIYDAQLHILSMLKDHVSLDFNVLNVSELPENQEPYSIIPANTRLIWER